MLLSACKWNTIVSHIDRFLGLSEIIFSENGSLASFCCCFWIIFSLECIIVLMMIHDISRIRKMWCLLLLWNIYYSHHHWSHLLSCWGCIVVLIRNFMIRMRLLYCWFFTRFLIARYYYFLVLCSLILWRKMNLNRLDYGGCNRWFFTVFFRIFFKCLLFR